MQKIGLKAIFTEISKAVGKSVNFNGLWKIIIVTLFAALLTFEEARGFNIPDRPSQSENIDNLNSNRSFMGERAKNLELPDAGSKKTGLFVDIINSRGYIKNGHVVAIPEPSRPQKIEVEHLNYETAVSKLKLEIEECINTECNLSDLSTEEAIAVNNGYAKIALNFANEHHIGGGPGIHLDPKSEKMVYDGKSSKAQEESLCQHSDLMASLTKLAHILKKDGKDYYMSYYKDPFDSKTMAYVSRNHLFAIRGGTFYDSVYLDSPVKVSFVTSAAPILCGKTVNAQDEHIQDLQLRISAHLLASAVEAVRMKQLNPLMPVELILGAFGCGAFAPKNGEEYAKIVANLYVKELRKFEGIFDKITFAVPTFGSENAQDPCYRNYKAFEEVFAMDLAPIN